MASAEWLDIKKGEKLIGLEDFEGGDVAWREMSAARIFQRLLHAEIVGIVQSGDHLHAFYYLAKDTCCHFDWAQMRDSSVTSFPKDPNRPRSSRLHAGKWSEMRCGGVGTRRQKSRPLGGVNTGPRADSTYYIVCLFRWRFTDFNSNLGNKLRQRI